MLMEQTPEQGSHASLWRQLHHQRMHKSLFTSHVPSKHDVSSASWAQVSWGHRLVCSLWFMQKGTPNGDNHLNSSADDRHNRPKSIIKSAFSSQTGGKKSRVFYMPCISFSSFTPLAPNSISTFSVRWNLYRIYRLISDQTLQFLNQLKNKSILYSQNLAPLTGKQTIRNALGQGKLGVRDHTCHETGSKGFVQGLSQEMAFLCRPGEALQTLRFFC